MPNNEKGFTLLEALFAMLIASAGIIAALEINSIALKNRAWNNLLSQSEAEIESLMERDRGRLRTLIKSGEENPVGEIFAHLQTSPLSCEDRSKLKCEEAGIKKEIDICRAPEDESGVVKIKYIMCAGDKSFTAEQFIYVREK